MSAARIAVIGTLSFALLGLVACDNKSTDATTATKTSDITGDAATTPPAVLSSDDKEFVTKAAQGGMFEVALGQVVEKSATSADVKSFASTMVTDHGKANDELSALAAKKGVTVPAQLDDSKKSKVDDYSKMTGAKLDRKYADDMVEDHEDDVKEFKKASTDLKDPDLRAWAAKTLPVLEHHLQMAKDIDAKLTDAGVGK